MFDPVESQPSKTPTSNGKQEEAAQRKVQTHFINDQTGTGKGAAIPPSI